MICVNVNSPFNYCRQWLKSPAQKAIQDDDSWGCQAHIPRWARPGFLNLDVAMVSAGTTDIGPAGIGGVLSLYFTKHKSVVQGLIKMHSLFQWQGAGSSDSDINLHPQVTVIPPPDTHYIQIMEILRGIRDKIDPAMDGHPTNMMYEDARAQYD